jgi:LysR family transcriptional activator of glutamate synthase operon
MQLNQLKYFVAVATYGSITKAAERLYISQPAMSQAIAQLEQTLGVRLFKNRGRQIEITSIGKHILVNAQFIIDECDLIKHKCELLSAGDRSVTFSAPCLSLHFTRLVQAFLAEHPTINVVQHPAALLHGKPPEITIDATLDENFTERRKRIMTEEIGLVVPTASPLYKARSITLRELSALPLTSLAGSRMYDIENYFCNIAGFTPIREREIQSFSELQELVYREEGTFFYPFKLWGIETIHPNRIVRIMEPHCYRHIYIEKTFTPGSDEDAVQAFFNFVVQFFQN